MVLALCSAPSASAHQTDPTLKAVLDGVSLSVPGVQVHMEHALAIQLVVDNDTAVPVGVLDDTGEPFLKIASDGVVANVASPSWFLSSYPDGGPLPDGFLVDAPPRWVKVAARSSWAWYDHRMHPGDLTTSIPTTWTVPLSYGDQRGEVRGHFEARQLFGSFRARVVDGGEPFAQATVQVAFQGRVPGLALRNDGSQPITVLGAAGEPFARVSSAGVEVNQHSPSWLATAQSQGYDLAALEFDAAAPPDWFSVGTDPTFFWLEMRGLYAEEEPPPSSATQGTLSLVSWTVELQQGAATATVTGATDWVPAPPEPTQDDSASSGITFVAVAAPLLVVGLLLMLLWRRRSRP
jgi:hypothetical protein